MTHTDRPAFVQFMVGLGETYGEPVSDARLEIYWRALEDLPLEAVRQAANVHVRTQKFFPRPSELREACEGRVEDRAELAWMSVLALVRRVGCYGTPTWPDEAMRRAALDLYGSWPRLCECLPSDGPEFLGCAKQFKAAFAAYTRAQETRGAIGEGQGQAVARLRDLKANLEARGLPTGNL